MFEYKKIKVELENFKCPEHGKSAIASFKDGKLILESVCCDEHRKFLMENLNEIVHKDETELLLQSVTGM